MSRSAAAPWWRNAIVYAVDLEAFSDSDGDGIGDIAGLRSRLDHIVGLGATCLWLLPFYVSPNLDGHYDVADHCDVDPRLGSRPELLALIAEAHGHGLRVVVDLVASHTSDRHRWFQAARAGDGRYRDYYVWRTQPDPSLGVEPIFPGVCDSVWAYDERAGAYYLHRFYDHEPDLNIANPAVRDEIKTIAKFWLAAGVDGLRLDAAPYLAAKAAWADPSEGGLWFLRELAGVAAETNPDAVVLPESDVEPERYATISTPACTWSSTSCSTTSCSWPWPAGTPSRYGGGWLSCTTPVRRPGSSTGCAITTSSTSSG